LLDYFRLAGLALILLASFGTSADGQGPGAQNCLSEDGTAPPEQVLRSCDELLRASPQNATAWYRRGAALDNLSRLPEAIESFDAALRIDPQMANALADRGVAHVGLGNRAQALADLTEAIRLRPSAFVYYNRGTVYYQLANYEAAIADYSEVIRNTPEVDIAYVGRGNAYGALRRHREAVEDLRVAVRMRPSALAWRILCWNLAAIEAYSEGLAACGEAAQLDRAHEPHGYRGFINLKLRRHDMATRDYEAGLLSNPDDAHLRFGLGLARLGLGRTAEARASFEAALRLDPSVAGWYALYGLTVPSNIFAVPANPPQPTAFADIPSNSPRSRLPRVALVIGVSNYVTMGNLVNPTNDARAMAAVLRSAGFEVILLLDPDYRTMMRAVIGFRDRMAAAGERTTGLFYFAGHGIQSRGVNYLIPARPQIRREADLAIEAVSADAVLLQMEEAGAATNILILDACRNMPLARSFRSGMQGLAQMQARRGSFIAYSTAPGDVAEDGEGLQNSPFASALVSEIQRPGHALADTFMAVRRAVVAATDGRQTPWESSSMVERFLFMEAQSASGSN